MLQASLRSCGRKHDNVLVSRPWQRLSWKAGSSYERSLYQGSKTVGLACLCGRLSGVFIVVYDSGLSIYIGIIRLDGQPSAILIEKNEESKIGHKPRRRPHDGLTYCPLSKSAYFAFIFDATGCSK